MQFEYDPEKLIEEIRKRPGIWDFEDAGYRAKAARIELWKEVVNELMQSDAKLTKSEIRELELQLQKKWKSIRDSFQKYIQNPKRTKRPYIYTKQLQFLFKSQNQEQTDSQQGDAAASSESDEVPIKRSKKINMWKQKKKFKLAKDDDQSSEEDNDNADDNVAFDNNDEEPEYLPYETNFSDVPVKVHKVTKPDEFVFANVDAQPKLDADDPDKLFLLSLLPHMKAVPEEARLNVKMDLMQVLKNATFMACRDQKIF